MMTRTRTETARVPISGAAISNAPVRSIVHRMALIIPKACWPSITIWVAGSIASRPRRQPIRWGNRWNNVVVYSTSTPSR